MAVASTWCFVVQSILVFCPSRSFTANSAFSTLPSSRPSFSYLHTVHLSWCCLSSDIFFCREPSSHLPFLLEHPSAGTSFLVSGPANFFFISSSIILTSPIPSNTTAFFILSYHFTRSILLHNHISNAYNRFCSFRRSLQVSAPYNATFQTSLFLSSFSKGPQKMLLLLLLSSALLLDSSSGCYWYCTPKF